MNATSPEISIIVPVYKVENYIEKCLTSIKEQTFTNWECIIVDDGSPDNSGKISDMFVKDDSRFKVVHKTNGGLSSARNAGLSISKGKYVALVDSDDWLEKNYLYSLYRLITDNDADLAICGYVKEFKTFKREKSLKLDYSIIEGKNVAFELLFNNRLPGFMWNKLFRKEIIISNFPEGKVYEDYYVMNEWAENIKKIVITPEILYHYRVRKGSITSSSNSKNQLDFMQAIFLRTQVLKNLYPLKFTQEEENAFIYRNFLERAKIIARKEKDKIKRENAINLIRKEIIKWSVPPKERIGSKLWKRANLLINNPAAFIRKMDMAGKLDIHDKFCASQAYD